MVAKLPQWRWRPGNNTLISCKPAKTTYVPGGELKSNPAQWKMKANATRKDSITTADGIDFDSEDERAAEEMEELEREASEQ